VLDFGTFATFAAEKRRRRRSLRRGSAWHQSKRDDRVEGVDGDVVIHVTKSPGDVVIQKCRENLGDGLRPIVVTLQRELTVAEGLAGNASVAERIDIFGVEQFVALNLYEWAKFGADGRKVAVANLVERYNAIVDEVETDPSLRIELRK
jgi:hypothetical protein